MQKNYLPKLPDDTIVLEQESKITFFVPSKPDWISVNPNGASLLRLCDGAHNVDDIKNILKNHQYSNQAILLLKKLHNINFFKEKKLSITTRKSAPIHSFHLNMTELCNLQCIYCYAEERIKVESNYLALDNYYSLIDEVFLLNQHACITFTGGEPLLNPYTYDVAKYAKSKGMPTFLLTNGTLISEQNAEKIVSLFDNIRISIDGSSAHIHDSHRGEGSFEKALRGITFLNKKGRKPLIAMTVTQKNIHDIDAMAKCFGNRLTFQPLYQVGRARNSNLDVSGKEYFCALKNAKGVEPYGGVARAMENLRHQACGRCAIGEGEISIAPNGNVYPCHMLHIEEFCAGNIKEKSFTEIYRHSKVLANIRQLSVTTRNECHACPLRFLCCGGCWARTFLEYGNFNKADPFCEYDMLAFREALLHV